MPLGQAVRTVCRIAATSSAPKTMKWMRSRMLSATQAKRVGNTGSDAVGKACTRSKRRRSAAAARLESLMTLLLLS